MATLLEQRIADLEKKAEQTYDKRRALIAGGISRKAAVVLRYDGMLDELEERLEDLYTMQALSQH